ncbi:Conserved oligomeric Golgi complex subunit 5, partial [Cucurbita argyrosperma subsp. sororia]
MGKKKTWSLKKVRKELWPWRFSLFGRNPMDLQMIHFVVDNVFFKIVSVVEAIVLFSNFHRTTKLLHHTIRAFRFSKKLRDLASASVEEPEKVDLAKAAQLRFEKLSLCYEFDLAGVDAVDEELKWGMH